MASSATRVIILDPDFEHDGGHNYVANQILAAHIKGSVQILCPVTLPAAVTIDQAELHRRFPGNSYVADAPPRNTLRRIAGNFGQLLQGKPALSRQRSDFTSALLDHFQAQQVSCDDAILVHTGSTFLFDILLAALERWPRQRWPSLHLRQLRPLENQHSAAAVHARLRSARQFTEVFMYAETDAFARQLLQLGHDEDKICKLELSDLRQNPGPVASPADTFRLAVLGTVRREKGHQRLASIASAYHRLADRPSDPGLKLTIHAGIVKNSRLFNRVIRDLTNSGTDFEVVQHPPGVAGHWHCLATSHAVLVPYEADRYTDRGSGICIDAVAGAKPLVVSANCTLQEYIRNGNGEAGRSDEKCAAGILKIARDYTDYAGNAATQATRFRTAQRSHPLFSRLATAANAAKPD